MQTTFHPHLFDAAIVRTPAPSVVAGLRDGDGPDPDFANVCEEHTRYIAALENAGVDVLVLPALADFPDALFVEDPALVFTQGAIKLRPGAPSRRGEVAHLNDTLEHQFDTVLALETGYADGGDILFTPSGVMIGLSSRTDEAGAKALQLCLRQLELPSKLVSTPPGVLHFKSVCSLLDENRVISTRRLAASGVFNEFDILEVPDGEEAAANALRVNDHVLIGQDYPRTIDLLDQHGYQVVVLPTTEIARIDAGLSCMSLRWKRR